MAEGPAGTENLEVMEAAVRYNAWLLDLVRGHLGPAKRVLDFGAGRGTFARVLNGEGGRAVVCVEPDAAARSVLAAGGLSAHASTGDIADASLDAVYSLNVLEHIDDDLAALSELRRCLKPGGRLLIYVPAFTILFSAMDRRVGHLRRYRRGQLLGRLEQAGFEVLRGRYADSFGFFAALAYRLGGDKGGGINPNALVIYDRLVFPVSCGLDFLTGRVFGKNVWALARRPDQRTAR